MSSQLKPWVKFEELPDNGGRFVFSPLSKGMGTTVGNSLRRVLLSSLAGYAISSVKIDGVKHEFSSIPGVVEDVFDVISNLKGIVFKSDDDSEKLLKIAVSKKGKVFAKDILLDGDIEIVNPEVYIAEVTSGSGLKIEMIVRRGVGYESAENNRGDDSSIDTISLDSSYSPVVKVNHQVENIRVGKELDYDSLSLDVWTNGSVDVAVAVRSAAGILVDHFQLFGRLNEKPIQENNKGREGVGEKSKDSALSLSVDDLELSARSSNCLKRAGIDSVAELIEKDITELIQIKNFGKKSADEINDKLKHYGLALKGTIA
ncbi:DNA-directed RNA polymerase subunit alpha [bacterium]|nr:DNA-directed RNA polymerase subunit alpha [bacterium]